MKTTEPGLVVGIDLGTTNSEISAFLDGRVRIIGPGETKMLPSCVGFSPGGELLVGQAARNQQLLHPELSVRSIKRRMGSSETVKLGEKTFTPAEISALILRELATWATRALGRPVERAVITVPAYFSDSQRQATREAGALAGLEVVRILNEPTAAGLAYGYGEGERRTAMIYDLGGGTFDVSIVTLEGEITEVLASHGNNHLGGDDFDDLLLEHLEKSFQAQHGIDLRTGHPSAHARLWWAAEDAKMRLSAEPYVTVREEALIVAGGVPLNFELEIAREDFEGMIRPLVESTLESVSRALHDAGKKPSDLDAILLVGGSTRIPLVSRVLRERAGLEPRQDVHPDLAVALGAGVLASRLAGHDVESVLVDVSPYSFGPSYLGERGGVAYPYCYHPIIYRNTPLPITRTERYFTSAPYQKAVDIEIYQGDDDDALKNILIGNFRVDDLKPTEEPSEVLCRMRLDIDGILHVTAIEKSTGKSKDVTITNALHQKSAEEIREARDRLQALHAGRFGQDAAAWDEGDEGEGEPEQEDEETHGALAGQEYQEAAAGEDVAASAGGKETVAPDPEWDQARQRAENLVNRSRGILERMHDEDREEAIDLHEQIAAAVAAKDRASLDEAANALQEFLFFVEGK